MHILDRRFFVGLFLLFILSFVSSCGENMSLETGSSWFLKNNKILIALNGLLLQQPAIQRIDPGLGLEFVPKYEEFDSEMTSVYKEIENKCILLGIKSIAVARQDSSSMGELISIRYTLRSSGLSVSGGKALSIVYIPNKLLVSKLYSTPQNILTPLDKEDWYIVDYREGRK